ncbi:MAG: hypothetical protein RLZZ628_2894 [Bacteroidota bacterium]|jgi:hypothetical protein
MKTNIRLLAAMTALFGFTQCQKEVAISGTDLQQRVVSTDGSEQTASLTDNQRSYRKITLIYGRKQVLGQGTVRAFVKMSNYKGHQTVEEVGMAFSEAALVQLPHEAAVVLAIPDEAAPTHLKHIYLTFAQEGHPPMNIYTVPHFDIHFYNTTSADRQTIIPDDPRFFVNPPAGFLPATYVQEAAVPQMGMHWVDPASPEFHGERFTSTFIYGSLNGKVTFYEPMITLAHILNTKSRYYPILQATKFAQSGLYANEYGLRYNTEAHEHQVVLRDFRWASRSLN